MRSTRQNSRILRDNAEEEKTIEEVPNENKSEYETYFDPRAPGSFGGAEALQRQVRELTGKIKPIGEVRKWLTNVSAYTLHHPVKRKFKTNRTIVYTIDEQFQADLADVSNLSHHNDGYKFLLTCIDIFSKYAWVIPLKDKSAHSVRAAFSKIFAERTPSKLQTDQGKEFQNSMCQKLFKDNKIRHFNALTSDAKCAVVERFNRTFKTKMWRYFTHANTYRYLNVLDDLVDSYNNTYHSSIKMKPSEVNEFNVKQVWRNLYGDYCEEFVKNRNPAEVKFKFNVGDHVRLSGTKVPFRKGYENGWTEEIYTISKRHAREPVVYNVKDAAGEVLKGVFYEQELQLVTNPEWFVIEDVGPSRGVGKKKEYYVKFRGYPESFNQWVPASDVRNISSLKNG